MYVHDEYDEDGESVVLDNKVDDAVEGIVVSDSTWLLTLFILSESTRDPVPQIDMVFIITCEDKQMKHTCHFAKFCISQSAMN